MMRSFRIRTVFVCFFLISVMCTTRKKVAVPDGLQVFVSIAPQKYIVEKIGGEYVSVTTLIPAGASPHTFEPKPAQLAALSRAGCYFTIGLEIEKAWLPRLDIKNDGCRVVASDSGIVKMEMSSPCMSEHTGTDHEAVHHHHESGTDPHVWLAPSLVKKIAATVTGTLCRLDTAHATYFKHRLTLFERETDSLAGEIKVLIDSCRGAGRGTFLVFHPSWGYFAREFSLRQLAIEVEGREPSLREIGEIASRAKADSVRTIFIQPQFSRKSAEIIAKSIGAGVAVADPMAEAWSENLITFAGALCR